MSLQPDWNKYLDAAPADSEEAGAGPADKDDQNGEAGEPAETELASDTEEPEPGSAERRADGTSADVGLGGWSGRAIGPLSRLLPGGAVDLSADEMPAEQPTDLAELADDRQPDHAAEAVTGPDSAADAGATGDGDAAGEPDAAGSDDRWHSVLVGFVDDPRGSVEAAGALIDKDIAAHIAMLARCREAMHAAWQANSEPDTEALRVAMVRYRDLRKRLADLMSTLAA